MRNDYDLDDEEEEEEDDDPNEPGHRDYDLSTSAPYDFDGPAEDKPWFLRRGVILLVSLLLIFSLLLPYIWRLS